MAKNREDKTGVILADLLVRTDVDSYVLGGPSLGARAMAVTAQALGSNPDGPKIEDCLLYTSDAADERSSVDLGGRRLIKKQKEKKKKNNASSEYRSLTYAHKTPTNSRKHT